MIIKALMVVTLMSGAEYAVDMPSMKSCLKRKDCYRQSEMVEESASHSRQIFKGKRNVHHVW